MSEWVISASVLIVFVIAIRYFFRDRMPMRMRYALWLLVAVRLLVPISFAESGLSVLNYLAFRENGEAQDGQVEAKEPQGMSDLSSGAVRLDGYALENGSDGQVEAATDGSGQSDMGMGQETERQEDTDALGRAQSGIESGQGDDRREHEKYQESGQKADGQEPTGYRQSAQDGNRAEWENSREEDGTGMASGMLSVSSEGMQQGAGSFGSSADTGADTEREIGLSKASVLLGVWLAGAALFACILAVMNGKYRKRVHISRRRLYTELESRLPVYVSSVVAAPCMFGLIHPAVYLNPRVAKDGSSLRYILAHENTHYRHLDNLWVWVRAICVCVHWYNPFVWLAACLSRQDGELACDERALELLGEGERIRYGRTLLDFSEQGGMLLGGLKLSTAMSGGKKQLKERLLMIVGHPRRHAGTLAAVMILTVLCSLVTFTGRVNGQEADDFDKIAGISESASAAASTGVPAGNSAEGPAESTSILPVDLNDGKDYTLKIGGEAVPGSGEYRINQIELNWIHDRTEETLQTIRPQDVKVLYTRSLAEIRSGDGKMWSYRAEEEPLFAKPLCTGEDLPASEVGRFQADTNGLILSNAVNGTVFVADLNFDGYEDFYLQGGRGDVNIPYYCYLWDAVRGQFVPGYMVPNLRVNEAEGLLESATDDGDGRHSTKYYRFDESGILHMVRYVEENEAPDAVFPKLDLTYCEISYALPAVDEWDYGTRYGGALTERFVYWAREALTELYQWSGTKLDTLCFTVTEFGDFFFGNTPGDIKASRTFYSRTFGARAGFLECIEQMDLVTERVVWYSPVTQWNVPKEIDKMSDLQLVEWYFGRSALTAGETIGQIYREGEEYIVETESLNYYSIFLQSSTREVEVVTGPYDSYPMH